MIGLFPKKATKQQNHQNAKDTPLTSSLEKNMDGIKSIFEPCDDLIFHKTELGKETCCLIYLSYLVNKQAMYELEKGLASFSEHKDSKDDISSFINKRFLYSKTTELEMIQEVSEQILFGNAVLLIDKSDRAFSFQTMDSQAHSINNQITEQTIRGPKEAFNESLSNNLALIRKRIKTPSLKMEKITLGEQTKTQIRIVYIKGIVNEDIVKEVKQRLSRIAIDGILESHYIESMIKDAPRSPVPTVYSTERPDRICGSLLDGKVAILVDGTAFALTVPAVFVEFLHASDDYYDGSLVSTFIRWIRFLGLFVTLILPAFFVALTTFHQDLLQNPFIIRIASNREALPYPVLIESLFMLLTYELLREAGLRMPKPFGGPLLTILGLVIVSQAAIEAGVIGPILAVVISVTALTSFILPNYAFHQIIRLAGIPILILAGLFGFMGIIVGLMFGLAYLVSLRSFGVPYFSPVSPARKEGWKDVFIRAPWWAMETRAAGLGIENSTRAADHNFAKPPKQKGEDE